MYPEVRFATDTMYACSEPGQEGIISAIREHGLDGVVVASCNGRACTKPLSAARWNGLG